MKNKNFVSKLVVLGIVTLLGVCAQATPVNHCWILDPRAPQTGYRLPPRVCLNDLQVFWRSSLPTDVLTVQGSPMKGDFELFEFEETSEGLISVQAAIFRESYNVPGCFQKRAALLQLNFDVSADKRILKNLDLKVELYNKDATCRQPGGRPGIVHYLFER